MNEIDTRAEALAARPYAFTLTRGEDGVYTVHVLELPGAISEGDTPDEALANGRDALAGVIAAMLDRGQADSRAVRGARVLGDNPVAHPTLAARTRGCACPPRQRQPQPFPLGRGRPLHRLQRSHARRAFVSVRPLHEFL